MPCFQTADRAGGTSTVSLGADICEPVLHRQEPHSEFFAPRSVTTFDPPRRLTNDAIPTACTDGDSGRLAPERSTALSRSPRMFTPPDGAGRPMVPRPSARVMASAATQKSVFGQRGSCTRRAPRERHRASDTLPSRSYRLAEEHSGIDSDRCNDVQVCGFRQMLPVGLQWTSGDEAMQCRDDRGTGLRHALAGYPR